MSRLLALALVLGGAGGILAANALAANSTPNAQYGAVAVQTTATLIPPSSLNSREGFAFWNLGGAIIYCGYDDAVTTSTGWPVASGGSVSQALGYNTTSKKMKVYCVAASAQTSPADTRWAEIL